ncbi:hypothetical protein GIB67_028026 [Kingdonia uniflora]|uniref:G domain-containing protein n=1 Tax=Kingdonia uniflora TaxID=39325 RepID=A0A7J7NE87_9MAGN|nr:hypothetical protein GIB67_028026 [Kingdonia uniflora]
MSAVGNTMKQNELRDDVLQRPKGILRCSTTVESLPPPPSPVYPLNGLQPELQKMRILVGAPLRFQAKHQIVTDSLTGFPSMDTEFVNPGTKYFLDSFRVGGGGICPDGLNDLIIFCTSDFTTVSKEVCVRTRRVRLVGIEGAGKTSLYNAILGRARLTSTMIADSMQKEPENQEGIAGGLCFSDTAGVNLQDLNLEVARFRDGLSMGVHDLKWRTDLIVLVHNLSHKIPRIYQSNTSQAQPALLLFLNEAKALGIPWVLAITNKFSVSAHLQKAAVNSVLQAYEASPTNAEVINSCPYVTYSATTSSQSWDATDDGDSKGTQKFSFTPINFVRRPFQKKTTILPVEGVTALCQLIHRVLRDNEELSFEDLARDRLLLEMARDEAMVANASRDSQEKGNSMTASAVGASLGAGLGIVLAVVMGAASALRKP